MTVFSKDTLTERGDYATFLERKAQAWSMDGFVPSYMPAFLFDFQAYLVDWLVRKGRGAAFADCGLGKTPIQLVWAANIVQKTNRPVLIIAPLAVGSQTRAEGEKFGIETHLSREGHVHKPITITNYEQLHKFNPHDFSGVVCDESSILKNFDGKTKAAVTEFLRKMPYRLLCTATAAPNDYIEIGTSSEALGELGYTDMLTKFFINDQRTIKPQLYRHKGQKVHFREQGGWRFKGHAEQAFWRWVASWARAMRRPSDIGFSDDGFLLPALVERETVIAATRVRPGMLFDVDAIGLADEREVRRRTLIERCEAAAHLVGDGQPAVIWCHLNDEGDLLSRLIPDAKQISGKDSDDAKEEKFEAFRTGQVRVLVIKPKIGAFGLNWQHCAHVVYFPSHSYEQYYQAIRRCWRFGQKRPVTVDIVRSNAEERVMQNLQRKNAAADRMFSDLVLNMRDAQGIGRNGYHPQGIEVPSWL